MPPIMLLSQTLCIPTDFRLIPFLRRGRTTVGGRVSNLLWSIKFLLFYDLFLQFFGSLFIFLWYFCFARFGFASDFQLFALKRNKRKNGFFFATKRNKFCLIFASFRFNRKRTAHPSRGRVIAKSTESWEPVFTSMEVLLCGL
jgi:hypothetical protein